MNNPFETIDARLTNIECLLLDLKHTQKDPKEDNSFLSIQEASELINLSVATIYVLTSRSEIPHMKKGKRLYFSKQDLTAWITDGRKKTVSQINSEADNFLGGKKKGLKDG